MTTAAQPVPSAYAQPKAAADCALLRDSTPAPSTPGTCAFQWEMVQDGASVTRGL